MTAKMTSINIQVKLDENKRPEKITWKADDQGERINECKAMALAFFDKEYKDTYKIDLWTNELQVIEMDRFMFQTLRGLVDSYVKATNNVELGNELQRFVQYFGEKTEIIPTGE